jgi:uncharacterized membrane protein
MSQGLPPWPASWSSPISCSPPLPWWRSPSRAWRLAYVAGYPLSEGWIVLSIILYMVTGLFWLPVVWMQMELRRLAEAAASSGKPLPQRYHRLFWLWFAFGFPAFGAVAAIFWLMIARPELSWFRLA